MAYQATDLTDDDKRKQDAAAGRPTSGVVDSSVPMAGGSGDPAAAPPTPGTGFVNLQQYLDQNKGEGARLANAATGDLAAKADAFKTQAQNTVTGAQQGFTNAAGGDTAAAVQSGLKDNAAGTFSDASKFLGAGYTGPTAAATTAGLDTDAKALQDSLGKVDDAGTQAAALQAAYGANGKAYTPGFGLLDRFLVGGTDSGRAAIGAVKAKAGNVAAADSTAAQQLADAEATSRKQLADNQAAVKTTAAQTQQSILSNAAQKAAAKSALNAGKEGGQDANVADALNDDPSRKADLDALLALQNAGPYDYTGSFKAGYDMPTDVGDNGRNSVVDDNPNGVTVGGAVGGDVSGGPISGNVSGGGGGKNGDGQGIKLPDVQKDLTTMANTPSLNNANQLGGDLAAATNPLLPVLPQLAIPQLIVNKEVNKGKSWLKKHWR